jgi:hypothetical protein
MKQFTAIIHQGEPDEGGFWATCPEVQGANGQGETKDESLRNLGEAVQLLGRKSVFERFFKPCKRLMENQLQQRK